MRDRRGIDESERHLRRLKSSVEEGLKSICVGGKIA